MDREVHARAEEDTEGGQKGEEEIEHEPMVVTFCYATTKRIAGC
jgi:hypothetical protein